MKSTKLLTLLSIGIASWMHSCIEKKKNTDKGEVTAEACKAKQMKFDTKTKKCTPPDQAFCSGLNPPLGFKESPPTCIAKDGTGNGTGGTGSTADAGINIKWDGVRNPLQTSSPGAIVPRQAGTVSVAPTNKHNHQFEIRIWVATGSNCEISTNPPSNSTIPVLAGAPTGTKECKVIVLANNRTTNAHDIEPITIKFN